MDNQGKIDETKGADPKAESQNPLGQEMDSSKMFAFLDDPKFQEAIKQTKGDEEKFYMASLALSEQIGDDSKMDDALLKELQSAMKDKGMLQNEPQEAQAPSGEEIQEGPEGQEQEEGAAPEGEKQVGDESTPDENFGEVPPGEGQEEPVEGEELQDAPAEDVQPDEGIEPGYPPQEGQEEGLEGQEPGMPGQDPMQNYAAQMEQRVEKIIQRSLRVIEALLRDEE